MRSQWISCYMSVSYPLKEIIVTSPYGQRKDPFTGKRNNHNGLDLRARNEEVYAMMPGEVVKVSSDKRSGKYVTIRHDNYTISYCHLSKALVKKVLKSYPEKLWPSVAILAAVQHLTYMSLSSTVKSTLTLPLYSN